MFGGAAPGPHRSRAGRGGGPTRRPACAGRRRRARRGRTPATGIPRARTCRSAGPATAGSGSPHGAAPGSRPQSVTQSSTTSAAARTTGTAGRTGTPPASRSSRPSRRAGRRRRARPAPGPARPDRARGPPGRAADRSARAASPSPASVQTTYVASASCSWRAWTTDTNHSVGTGRLKVPAEGPGPPKSPRRTCRPTVRPASPVADGRERSGAGYVEEALAQRTPGGGDRGVPAPHARGDQHPASVEPALVAGGDGGLAEVDPTGGPVELLGELRRRQQPGRELGAQHRATADAQLGAEVVAVEEPARRRQPEARAPRRRRTTSPTRSPRCRARRLGGRCPPQSPG